MVRQLKVDNAREVSIKLLELKAELARLGAPASSQTVASAAILTADVGAIAERIRSTEDRVA